MIGPTGSGKTWSVVIPNVLGHRGPLVVLDVKGEIYRTTHRDLRQRGCPVLLLDPFGMLPGCEACGLDLIRPIQISGDPAATAHAVAEMLSPSETGRDPFWPSSGNNLLASVLHHAAWSRATPGVPPRTMADCIDLLHADDVVHALAVMLDTVAGLPAEIHRAFAAFLQMPEITRGGVLASAQAPLKALSGRGLRAALSGDGLDLEAVTRGDEMALFIAWPPSALKSHAAALRLILSMLLDAIFKRSGAPAASTLLMVDEAGTIGPVPQIETAFTLARGYGCRVTAVFQSVHQLESCYGTAARTIFDNAGTISILPPPNPRCARELADILGVSPGDLLSMAAEEVLVACRGRAPHILRRADGRWMGHADLARLASC